MNGLFPLDRALQTRPSPGNLAAEIARFGGLELEFYQPKGVDPQRPHERDELYIVARGTAQFCKKDDRAGVRPGDLLYVAARDDHRFEHFSDDFAAWVIFF